MTVRLVSPSKCSMWPLHVRSEESINATSCASLIRSIRKHGQRHPVLARMRPSTDGTEFELIYGARRLFAAQQLGIDLLVEVRDVDDRGAVIEMDIENRPREDITPYERGVNYGRWLRAGYFRTQMELAKELGVSEARVSRLLRYAELPAVVVAAFDSVRDIREEWAVRLANLCRDPQRRREILRRARERTDCSRKGTPQYVFDTLLRGVSAKRGRDRSRDEVIKGSSGRSLFRIAFHAKSLHLVLPREEVQPEILEIITQQVTAVLEQFSAAEWPRRVPPHRDHRRRFAHAEGSIVDGGDDAIHGLVTHVPS